MSNADKIIKFIQTLKVPEGRGFGKAVKLAPFQKQFIRGVFAADTEIAVLSLARGGGKTMLAAGVALALLLGIGDKQPRRQIVICARTQRQASILWQYVQGLAASLPEEEQARLGYNRAPYARIRYDGDDGESVIECLSATPKNALGLSPTCIILDERGSWPTAGGDEMEQALLSAAGKRNARTIMISTQASDAAHKFSHWLDDKERGVYAQLHCAPEGAPADDLEGILAANPGSKQGVGPTVAWLQAQAARAIAQGGHALAAFRNLNLNQRVSADVRDVLLTTDRWLALEVDTLPEREGVCVLGVDLGGSASMSAAALFWPETGRLEAVGAFPQIPTLAARGESDGVGDLYVRMHERGELAVIGENIVDTAKFLRAVIQRLDGIRPVAIVGDRYRLAEFQEAMNKAGLRVPFIPRGQGWKDSSEDCERFRQAAFDKRIAVKKSLLLRSAMAEAVVQIDPAGNAKVVKGRSRGRIDAAVATTIAVAEGMRLMARKPQHEKPVAVWA